VFVASVNEEEEEEEGIQIRKESLWKICVILYIFVVVMQENWYP
jgi:hypothetical protein